MLFFKGDFMAKIKDGRKKVKVAETPNIRFGTSQRMEKILSLNSFNMSSSLGDDIGIEYHNFVDIEDKKFKELVKSIEQVGLINPILVYDKNDAPLHRDPGFSDNSPNFREARYGILCGKHRYHAFKVLGRDSINAVVVDTKLTPEEVEQGKLHGKDEFQLWSLKCEMIAIEENIIRQELTGIALDKAILKRREFYTVSELVKQLGLSRRSVEYSRNRLEKSTDAVKKAWEEGKIKTTDVNKLVENMPKVEEITKKDQDDQNKELEKLIKIKTKIKTKGDKSKPKIKMNEMDAFAKRCSEMAVKVESMDCKANKKQAARIQRLIKALGTLLS